MSTITNQWQAIAAAMRLQPSMLTAPRQLGKSTLLAAAYGSGLHQNIIQGMDLARKEHPLQFISGYTFVSRDARFGRVPVYKTVTKNISEIMRAHQVPHTECCWYRSMDELASAVGNDVVAISWIRRCKLDELSTAVATLMMLDKEPVIVRAFEP